MLERCYGVKLWYTFVLVGFLLTFVLYEISIKASYVVYQIEPAYRRNPDNFSYVYPIETLSPNDYRKLIDLQNFRFTIFNKACNDTSPLLLIIVHSSPTNREKRNLIRNTWGKPSKQTRVLFALGAVQNRTLQQQLYTENKIHRDFIQGNFIDAYRNMTYKHLSVLKYAIYHCPEVKYVLKTDDDVFVNIEAMTSFIRTAFSSRGVSNLLLCKVMKDKQVLRSFRSKWRVSVDEYSRRTYPTYCLGFAILYSPDVLFELYKRAQAMRYFWIDDVHVTGDAVLGTNVTHTDVAPMIVDVDDVTEYNVDHFLYGDPNISLEEMTRIWEKVEERRSNVVPID